MPRLGPNPRILIVRLSAIGDVVHGLPVVNALRDAYPQAFIAWLCEGATCDLLRHHRAIDQLIELPKRFYKRPQRILALRSQLHELKFDVTLDLQGLTKSAGAAWLSCARLRIGPDGKEGRELSRWFNNCLVARQRPHVVERNLELLRPLGIDACAARFDLDDTPSHAQSARRILAALGLTGHFACISPGAGWRSKIWPAERYAAVARHLQCASALPSLVLWAGEREKAWAEEIVAASGGAAVIAPPTNLNELAALARGATVFVASDTGPLHIAAAVGTPCVGLFGPMPAERNGPYGPQHVTVQKICYTGMKRKQRTTDTAAMEAISVQDVCAACEQLLARNELWRQSA